MSLDRTATHHRLRQEDDQRAPRPGGAGEPVHRDHRPQRLRQVDPAARRCPGCCGRAPARCCWTARDIHSRPAKEVARRLGMLPQSSIAPDGITVAELVARGRFPHQKLVRQWSAEDEAAVVARWPPPV